jgi:RNA polymerase sigma-70 factor (ECF subfamily)
MPRTLDRAEFGRLFERHARLLWVVAASFVPRDEAQDVLQDAAVAALARLAEFDADTDFRAWMTQIVRFTAANARRRARRMPQREDQLDPVSRPSWLPPIDPRGHLDRMQDAFDDRLLHALEQLAPDARASLLLRSVLELSHGEVARVLGLPEGTVASHLHRARAELQASLAPASAPSAIAYPARGEPR